MAHHPSNAAQVPDDLEITVARTEYIISHFGGASALLRRLTPPGAGQASTWSVLATVQLLHMAARPLLRAQTEGAFRGEAPGAALRKHLEPLLEVRRLCAARCAHLPRHVLAGRSATLGHLARSTDALGM